MISFFCKANNNSLMCIYQPHPEFCGFRKSTDGRLSGCWMAVSEFPPLLPSVGLSCEWVHTIVHRDIADGSDGEADRRLVNPGQPPLARVGVRPTVGAAS